jgi:hypothetical protein
MTPIARIGFIPTGKNRFARPRACLCVGSWGQLGQARKRLWSHLGGIDLDHAIEAKIRRGMRTLSFG